LKIKFVISHGNLIEYVRNKYIFQDDDLDIRFDVRDQEKWYSFCSNENNNNFYNLAFDNRFNNINKQMYNGIQARLIHFENKNDITEYPNMDIHIDLVCSNISIRPWCTYDINFDKIRLIKYLNIDTYCPSEIDTIQVLTKEYGSRYMKPNERTIIK
jgi:phosphorylcholine metabolism protein LicD